MSKVLQDEYITAPYNEQCRPTKSSLNQAFAFLAL